MAQSIFRVLAICLSMQVAAVALADEDVYPVALLTFEERGANVKEFGPQVTDILFAELSSNPDLYLVDREELNKTMAEQSLSVSGAVKPDEAVQVGQLTGAKLLITGSVLQADKRIYLTAKIMSTETTRVVGASVNGKATGEIGTLVRGLAREIGASIKKNAGKIVAQKVATKDRAAALKKQLADAQLPSLMITIEERHIGQPTIDPAAETEVAFLAEAAGFEIVDAKEGVKGAADVLITGEGFSETAGQIGSLVSVRARVEIKAVDRETGKVLSTDRQTTVVVDATEQIAGKSALQEAAAQIAERMLPKLAAKAE